MKSKTSYNHLNRRELDEADWQDVLPYVFKYAVWRAKRYYWLGNNLNPPEELVQEAIARAYGIGENDAYRNWNKNKYPKLEDFLISIIDSITSHKVEHALRFKTIPIGSNEIDATSHEQELLSKDKLSKIVSKIKSVMMDDQEALEIFRCFEQGISNPREIAQITGYKKEKVYNIFKRLRRKVNSLDLR
jgi:DNA-directed RNA polymerase specialized sigma24 family protein